MIEWYAIDRNWDDDDKPNGEWRIDRPDGSVGAVMYFDNGDCSRSPSAAPSQVTIMDLFESSRFRIRGEMVEFQIISMAKIIFLTTTCLLTVANGCTKQSSGDKQVVVEQCGSLYSPYTVRLPAIDLSSATDRTTDLGTIASGKYYFELEVRNATEETIRQCGFSMTVTATVGDESRCLGTGRLDSGWLVGSDGTRTWIGAAHGIPIWHLPDSRSVKLHIEIATDKKCPQSIKADPCLRQLGVPSL